MGQILVSIICPVGYNYLGIDECLQSLADKTRDPSQIEILIKLDQGDEKNLEIVQSFQDRLPIEIVIMDGRGGYADLPLYSNTLALKAKGDLIWWWSDEVRMISENWDVLLLKYRPMADQIRKLDFVVQPMEGAKYPCLSRKWIELTGRWCGHPSIDSWVNTVAEKAGIPSIQTEIIIEDQNTLIEAQIIKAPDTRKRKRIMGHSILGWNTPEVLEDIQKDVDKLKPYV